MKSKSFIQDRGEQKNKTKLSKSMDFGKLYKRASDTTNAENSNNKQETPVVFKSEKAKKLGKINSFALEGATSTPLSNAKPYSTQPKVKPIIKNSSSYESSTETPNRESSPNPSMRKKRNKSVSFRLDDENESVIKRAKADGDSTETSKKNTSQKKLKFKKTKATEKENTSETNQLQTKDQSKWSKKNKKAKKDIDNNTESAHTMEVAAQEESNIVKKKNMPQQNKQSTKENKVAEEANIKECNETPENVKNKKKKKKKLPKQINGEVTENKTDNPQADKSQEEPVKKKKKNKTKNKKLQTVKVDAPELTEDLKNLNIGDNAHTLTNLLDEMNVADKSTKNNSKNPKAKLGKMKRKKTNSTSSTESLTLEKLDDEENKKEKVKWQKRKWNKDSKSGVIEGNYSKTVLVENLPLNLMLNYKKVLFEHFKSCGFIKEIGLAEVYPSEDTKPVFTTTICFGDTIAATKALEEDNSLVENHRIRVKKPLPPTQTTIVVKSYGELTELALSSAFHGAGKIRSIRTVVKGKNTIGTAFVEFDGPETVERAIKMAEEIKIGGKKMYASKFEVRGAKKKKLEEKEGKNVKQSDGSDSE